MAEWRYLRRWTESELAKRLEKTSALRLNFTLEEARAPEHGWNLVHSRAIIASEDSGPPVDNGTFERLWRGIERFEHSDPRIVVAHFRELAPFSHRRLLLELRALGLGFLCPVEIGAVREKSSGETTIRGFAVDTLEGHIERGREWFLLEKKHSSGEIRFCIEATWRPADFPNVWSRAGFRLIGRRYQRAWHRLAHLRLRRLAAGLGPHELAGANGISHEGPPMSAGPVQFYAQRGLDRMNSKRRTKRCEGEEGI